MKIINNKFILCRNFEVKNHITKPLFFYHIPKCAGTTFSVVLSHLFKKSHRLEGPAFFNNDKGGMTALDFFNKNRADILRSKYSFIHGHVPIDIHKYFKNDYFFVTIIRDPIERTFSHYNWSIVKKYISKNDDLEKLFETKKLPSNLITNLFLGEKKYVNKDDYVETALKNIIKNIDIIINIEKFLLFLKDTISYFNFPNLLFQSQQIAPKVVNKLDNKNLEIIKKYNKLDIELYNLIMQTKYDYKRHYSFDSNTDKDIIKNNLYLYSSPDLLINGKKNIILNENQIKKISTDLLKNNYEIKKI